MSVAIQKLRRHINENLARMVDNGRLDIQDIGAWAVTANLLLDEVTFEHMEEVNDNELYDPQFIKLGE